MAANGPVLYVYPGTEFTASIDPECLQVLTYLKLCQINHPTTKPVNIIYTCKHWQSPSGVFLALISKGMTYSGSDRVIKELKREVCDIDETCTEESALSEMIAYSSLLTDRLQSALMYLHWLDGKNYTELTRKWFGKMTSFPITLYVLSRTHRLVRQALQTGLPNTTSLEQIGYELISEAEETLDLLAARLTDRKYFYGDSPCSIDAMIFGYLELIYQYQLPGNDQLRIRLNSLSQLTNYCTRMRLLAFPDIKSRHVTMTSLRPLIPLYKDPTVWLCVGVASTLLVLQGIRVGLARKLVSNLKNRM